MILHPKVKDLNKKSATYVLMQRLTAYVSGKVQKTGYRARVLTIARDFGLKGYVQNLDDGRVKVVAEGEACDLESLLAALAIKNTIINVVDIKSEYSFAASDFESFVKVVSGGETDQRLVLQFQFNISIPRRPYQQQSLQPFYPFCTSI
jgi:acylphosphatase